jgi:hypothetical protein
LGQQQSVGNQSAAWSERYQELADHVRATNKLPAESVVGGGSTATLGGWLRYQRRRESRGIMATWQRDLLDKLPGFEWEPRPQRWRRSCDRTRDFLLDEGRVPRYRASDPRERELAAWVQKQRYLYRRGQLEQERIEALGTLPIRIV